MPKSAAPTPPTPEELDRTRRVWESLSRWQCEGLLIMSQWYSVDHKGTEVIKWAALAKWDQLGHELHCDLYRTLHALAIELRKGGL